MREKILTMITYIKGRAVVDYFIVPIICMELCDYFKVHLVSDIVSTLHCQHSKIPDHSLLEFKFRINNMVYHDINGDEPLQSQTNISQIERYENEQSEDFREVKDLTLCPKNFNRRDMLSLEPCQNWVITLILLLDYSYIYSEFVKMYKYMFVDFIVNASCKRKHRSKSF